jgi:hypothetical protein
VTWPGPGNVVYLTWCLEGLAGVRRDADSARLAGRPPPELIAAVTREEQS